MLCGGSLRDPPSPSGLLAARPGPASPVGILREQQFVEGLPAYLPGEVSVAAKPGQLDGLRADMALLERGDHWVAVAVVVDGLAETGTDRGTAVLPLFATIGAPSPNGSRRSTDPSPAAGAPLVEVRPLGPEGRVVAVARVDPGVVVVDVEHRAR